MIAEALPQAIKLAASEWAIFCATSEIPANINLRDRVSYFAKDFYHVLAKRLPVLKTAPEQLMLLIIAEGIKQSGSETKRMIELQLCIVLPASAEIITMAQPQE